MSRKLVDNKWVVRCGRTTPSPYIKDNLWILIPKGCDKKTILDIGCGNGRNMNYLKKYASKYVGLDIFPSCQNAQQFEIGNDRLPDIYMGWDLILVNYVFMFLNAVERKMLIEDIKKTSSSICKIVVELYPAKDSHIKNDKEMVKMQERIFKQLNWSTIKYTKGRL
jgi:SAM-dependent methyltransferase